jgi:hypothetical protein
MQLSIMLNALLVGIYHPIEIRIEANLNRTPELPAVEIGIDQSPLGQNKKTIRPGLILNLSQP